MDTLRGSRSVLGNVILARREPTVMLSRRYASAMLAAVMVVTMSQLPQLPEPAWEPTPPTDVEGVAVREVISPARPGLSVAQFRLSATQPVRWPEPGVVQVRLPASGRSTSGVAGGDGAPTPGLSGRAWAGDLPVRVGLAPLTAEQARLVDAGVSDVAVGPSRVTVHVSGQDASRSAGVNGLVVGVARADGARQATAVAVEVDYSSFRHAFGGDWASRLTVTVLGVCEDGGLSGQDVCRPPTALATANDPQLGVLVATVPLAGDGGFTMLAVSAGPDGDNGDYTATSLTPASTWQVSQQTGAFGWNYPLRMVPGVGGPEPNLSLSYSSQAVDGRTAGTNTQGSWIGDGWDMWPGFIERRYQSCGQDTKAVGGQQPNNKDFPTGDQCWFSDNATMSLNGGSVELVKDGANTFRGVDDDGSKIERLFNTSLGNGTYNGEYWKVTTPDGTQYFFGRHRRQGFPTDTAATNSTWTAPVYGNHPGEPCYAADNFSGSRCTQAWRWNLDYIIDPHGNTMTLFYKRETGAYGRELDPDKRTTYHRGGYLDRIEYGTRAGQEHTHTIPARVVFDTADRCLPGQTCAPSNPQAWPDVPWDQYCTAAPCTDQLAPTFWTQKRLDTIRAQVWRGSSFATVELWQLRHDYLDGGASEGESVPMWLTGITRTGEVTTAGGQPVTDPEITFDALMPLANRVDGPAAGKTRLNRFRIQVIYTESGAVLGIVYSPTECTNSNLPIPHTNTKRCFPQWYGVGDAEPTLDWFHKYVVTAVNVDDATEASQRMETHYQYLDEPAWRYADSELVPKDKRTWSQWRGYSQVRVLQGKAQHTQSVTEYLYMRGMHGDRATPEGGTKSVQITDSQNVSITDHEAHAGFLREETTLNGPGGQWITGAIYTPWRHGPTATSGPLKAYLTGTETVRTRTNFGSGNVRWTRTTTSFDTTYGMPTQVDDRGDESTTADEVCVRYEYARNTFTWMVDKVKRVETVGVRCSTTPNRPADVLSDQRVFFDDPDTYGAAPTRGLPVKTQEVGSWNGSSPVWVTTSRTTYDVHGRVLTSFDALDRPTTIAYTPATGGPVTGRVETNPAGHAKTLTLEPAWGLPTRVVDANNHVGDLTYDGVGRVTAVWLPGRNKATQTPNLVFEYDLRDDAPTAVTTRKLLPTGTGYLTSIIIYDGMLRERQTQLQTHGGGRVITDVIYDSRGLIAWESHPYYDNSNTPPSTTLVESVPQIPGITEYTYDGAGRTLHEIFLDAGQEAWRSSYSYGGDRVHVTPPLGATATTTITDARGRTTALRQYHAPTPTGAYDETSYAYSARDELVSVTDPAGNTWTFTYDQRGRQIGSADPDKGATTSTYDVAGQVSTVTDARGVTLGYTYDHLGRRTSVREGSPTGPLRAQWIYDTLTNGIGKLTRSIRHEDGMEYVHEITGYDNAGRPLGNRVIIPAGEGQVDGAYTTTTQYRVDGSPGAMNLPAVADLPFERLVIGYDDVGAPTFLSSSLLSLVGQVTYSALGDLTQRVLGPFGSRVDIHYSYDDATRRQTGMMVGLEIPQEVMDLEYSWDPAGNLVRIADSPASSTPSDTQCYRYDYLRRLNTAWTPADGDCGPNPTVAGLGGPAPYWHSWTYDTTGNRLSQTIHTAGGNSVSAYSHPQAGGPRPHTVTEVHTTGPGGSQLATYGYDQAGNMTSRDIVADTQTVTWDPEGRPASVTGNSGVTSFVYDADGNRLIRRDPAGKTLYLPAGQEIRYDNTTQTLTCTRYYSHLGTVVAVRTAAGITWLVADHHGTAELAIKAADLQTTGHRRTNPFGQVRGAAPGYWAGDQGFVGGTQDPTGLTHLGARLYDPSLGRFISVDPVIDVFDPQQMHGYAYGNNAPPTFSDPDGLFLKKVGAALSTAATAVKTSATAVGQWAYDNAGTISTVLAVAAMVCTVVPPLQAAAPFLGAGALAFGALETAKACSAGATMDCAAGAAGLVPGVRQARAGYQGAKALTTIAKNNKTKPGGAKADHQGGRKSPSCATANSFTPGTLVLLANGQHKPIEQVELGDQVLATNPESGQTNPETVVATITGHGHKTLIDITIGTDEDSSSDSAVVTATDGHPFWAANRGPDGRWIDAADLQPADLLLAPDGSRVRVIAVATYGAVATVHNLTITNHHTYYVQAGDRDTLVHNCGGEPSYVGKHRKQEIDVPRHREPDRPGWYQGRHRDPLIYDRAPSYQPRHLANHDVSAHAKGSPTYLVTVGGTTRANKYQEAFVKSGLSAVIPDGQLGGLLRLAFAVAGYAVGTVATWFKIN